MKAMNAHLVGFTAVVLVLGVLALGHYRTCTCVFSRRGRARRLGGVQ